MKKVFGMSNLDSQTDETEMTRHSVETATVKKDEAAASQPRKASDLGLQSEERRFASLSPFFKAQLTQHRRPFSLLISVDCTLANPSEPKIGTC